jgi:hypothetical protein
LEEPARSSQSELWRKPFSAKELSRSACERALPDFLDARKASFAPMLMIVSINLIVQPVPTELSFASSRRPASSIAEMRDGVPASNLQLH